MEDMKINRETYIDAPEGHAVYVQNPSYVADEGCTIIESVKHEALHIDDRGRKYYYHDRIYRRRSEDNGQTWSAEPDLTRESPTALDGEHRTVPMHVLDPNGGRLISFHCTYEVDTREAMFQSGCRRQRTYRLHYEISSDGGRSWSPSRQVVDHREGYDAVHWGPGFRCGESGGMADLFAWTFLDDGTLVFGLTATNAEAGREGVVFVQARWREDRSDLVFTVGDLILLPPGQFPVSCCEPAVAHLGGTELYNVMRCQGDESRGVYATRYSTMSSDGGLTWSTPEPLRYDDGATVWTPASYSQFVESSKTGRTYWIANILSESVHGQMPRYPLAMAEFDTEHRCVLRNTVRTIQELPDGAPEQRRYTNWGSYEERGTGDLILVLPEQPKHMDFTVMTRPEDFTADCIRYRIQI